MNEKTLQLLVILGSNRPGRIGERVGRWVLKSLEAFPEFKVDFAGLLASEQIRQVLAELRTHITRNGIAISGASQWKVARQTTVYPV